MIVLMVMPVLVFARCVKNKAGVQGSVIETPDPVLAARGKVIAARTAGPLSYRKLDPVEYLKSF